MRLEAGPETIDARSARAVEREITKLTTINRINSLLSVLHFSMASHVVARTAVIAETACLRRCFQAPHASGDCFKIQSAVTNSNIEYLPGCQIHVGLVSDP